MDTWKDLSIPKQVMLAYVDNKQIGGIYDLLDETQLGDEDVVELQVEYHPSAPMAQNPSMPSETAGLPTEAEDEPAATGTWASVREGWENRRCPGNKDPTKPSPH